MIKPGTLCMIRGVPAGTRGADCIGQIVVVEGQENLPDYGVVYRFIPELHTKIPVPSGVDTSPPEYLYPLDNPSEDIVDTHSTRKILETQ